MILDEHLVWLEQIEACFGGVHLLGTVSQTIFFICCMFFSERKKRCCFRKSQASAVFVSDDIHTQLYTIYWYNIIYNIYMFVSFPVFLSLTVSIPCHSQTEPAIGSSSLKPPSLIPTVYTRPLPSAPMCCSDRVPPRLDPCTLQNWTENGSKIYLTSSLKINPLTEI